MKAKSLSHSLELKLAVRLVSPWFVEYSLHLKLKISGHLRFLQRNFL